MNEDQPYLTQDRLSIDTLASINEDVTWALEISSHLRPAMSESVFSSVRQSLDNGSNHVGAFNILKQLNGPEDDRNIAEGSPLGPNSIFDLTAALDQARLRLNKGLKAMVLINGGANRVYNLAKPSTREIPPIQLQSLEKKVSKTSFLARLVDDVSDDYKTFEQSYKSLTADTLSKLTEQYDEKSENEIGGERGEIGGERGEFRDEKDLIVDGDKNTFKIPEIFERLDFHLEDPRVFRQVMEEASIFPENTSTKELQLIHNTQVQESLSHYLDTVEVRIAEEVSQTADSFFATLGDIKEIKLDSQNCLQSYDELISTIDTMQEKQARVGIELLNLIDQHRNINHLESSVLQIDAVVKGFDKALKLLNDGKNIDCLNEIIVLQNLVKGTSIEEFKNIANPECFALYPQFKYPLVDLSKVGALKNKQRSIEALKSTCCRNYIDEFIESLLQDLKNHSESVETNETITRLYKATLRSPKKSQMVPPSYQTIESSFRAEVSQFIGNLAKSGYLVLAFAQYQDKIIKEVKAIIRSRLPISKGDSSQMDLSSSNLNTRDQSPLSGNGRLNPSEPVSVAGSSKNGTLTNSIKSMSDQEFLEMFKGIYANLSECLRRLTAHQKFLLDISLSSVPIQTSPEIDIMSLDISNSIHKAIELTQVRLTKVLNVRLEALGECSLKDYLEVFLLTSVYLQECESINPGYNATEQGSSLNEWTKNHMSYYCHRTHTSALKKLVLMCEKDQWKELTGPELVGAQANIDELISFALFMETGSGFDGSSWIDSYLNFQGTNDITANESSTTKEPVDTESKIDQLPLKLTVKEHSFFVPSFAPTVVQMAKDYIIFARIFSPKAREVTQNFLTYFKVLNSRMWLAILSAGATKAAGLKHITTRHLALCLQTVGFFNSFLKSILPTLDSNCGKNNQGNADPEEQTFDQVIKTYEDHERALSSKIVSIIHDRTINHCNEIVKLDLSQPLTYPQQCHRYMETLVKEMLTVFNVLEKYLGQEDLISILSRIFDNYKKLLINCFCIELPQLKDFNEKHSLLKDIDYFRVKLGDLPGYGNSGQVIWENVNSLPTIEDFKMEEVMRNNIEGERAAAESARNSIETSQKTAKTKETSKVLDKSSSENVTATEAETEKSDTEITENNDNVEIIEAQDSKEKESERVISTETTESSVNVQSTDEEKTPNIDETPSQVAVKKDEQGDEKEKELKEQKELSEETELEEEEGNVEGLEDEVEGNSPEPEPSIE